MFLVKGVEAVDWIVVEHAGKSGYGSFLNNIEGYTRLANTLKKVKGFERVRNLNMLGCEVPLEFADGLQQMTRKTVKTMMPVEGSVMAFAHPNNTNIAAEHFKYLHLPSSQILVEGRIADLFEDKFHYMRTVFEWKNPV